MKNCLVIALCLFTILSGAQNICNPNGNLIIYTNYNGGILNINVDQNIPNLKIGIVSYEATSVNLSGAFLANVTGVFYAGFNGANNPCSNPVTTSINGAPVGATTGTVFAPAATLANTNGYSMIICGYSCSDTTNQGGCNTVDQIEDYFANYFTGSTLFAHQVQYNCWSGTYSVSAGGTCCPLSPLLQGSIGANQTVCSGATVAPLTSLTAASGGTGTIAYQWEYSTTSTTSGFFNVPLANGITCSPAPVSSTTYFRRGASTSANPVVYSNVVTVSVNPLPTPTANVASSICEGDSLYLNVSGVGAATYSWAGPGGFTSTQQSPVIPAAQQSLSGVFTVFVTDVNGCSATAYTVTQVLSNPVLAAAGTTVCLGAPATITVSGAASYTWTGPGAFTSNLSTITIPATTSVTMQTYTVEGYYQSCFATATVNLVVWPLPIIFVTANNTLICTGKSAVLTATGGATYSWLPFSQAGTASVSVSPSLTTTYSVQGNDTNNCSNKAAITISVSVCTGIESLESDPQFFSVYPNPNNGSFTIIGSGEEAQGRIINSVGQSIRTFSLEEANSYRISVSNLASGVYYVILTGRERQAKQVMIINEE